MQDGSDVDVGGTKDRALEDRAIVGCPEDYPAAVAPWCGTGVPLIETWIFHSCQDPHRWFGAPQIHFRTVATTSTTISSAQQR